MQDGVEQTLGLADRSELAPDSLVDLPPEVHHDAGLLHQKKCVAGSLLVSSCAGLILVQSSLGPVLVSR